MRFDKYRRVCQRCRNKQERGRQAAKHADDQEPHPEDVAAELPAEVRASASNGVNTGLRAELHHRREQRRELIETARSNGVTREIRDGREFTVVHLPAESRAAV